MPDRDPLDCDMELVQAIYASHENEFRRPFTDAMRMLRRADDQIMLAVFVAGRALGLAAALLQRRTGGTVDEVTIELTRYLTDVVDKVMAGRDG